jgi:hypothetical protein
LKAPAAWRALFRSSVACRLESAATARVDTIGAAFNAGEHAMLLIGILAA